MNNSKGDIGKRVRACLQQGRHDKLLGEILGKMGRVVAKKHALQSEHPVLVYENRVWIGNYSFANNLQFLQQNDIRTVISCLELPPQQHPNIQYHCLPLRDSKDQRFGPAVFSLIQFVESHPGNVFLHCFSGRSRSVALLLGLMMKKQRWTYDQALIELRKLYPIASPNTYFEETLRTMQGQLHSLQQSSDLLSNDLLGEPMVALSPKKTSENQFNLLGIEEDKPSVDLLDTLVPPPEPMPPTKQSPNLIDIFEGSPSKKTQEGNAELLDLSQSEPVGSEATQDLAKVESNPQQPLLSFVSLPTFETEVKPLPVQLTGEEQGLADSTDFSQKKVKGRKGRKK